MANAVKKATLVDSGALVGGGIYELWRVFDAELVNGAAEVDSILGPTQYGFDLRQFKFFGTWINATSASGTAVVQVQILEAWDDSTTTNYVSPNAGGTIVATLGETATVYNVAPAPMPRLRFRVTGGGANPADTIITQYFFCQS